MNRKEDKAEEFRYFFKAPQAEKRNRSGLQLFLVNAHINKHILYTLFIFH